MIGFNELLVVFAILVFLFGATKLPAVGEALGRSIKNFRRSANGQDEIEVNEKQALKAKTGELTENSSVSDS